MLASRWQEAAIGAGSQLQWTFPCGHVPKTTPAVPHWQCLNPVCRCKNPLGPGVQKSTLNLPESRDLPKVEAEMSMTRCAKCTYPLCFGRTIFSLQDMLRPSLERDRGRMARSPWTIRSFVPFYIWIV